MLPARYVRCPVAAAAVADRDWATTSQWAVRSARKSRNDGSCSAGAAPVWDWFNVSSDFERPTLCPSAPTQGRIIPQTPVIHDPTRPVRKS